MRACVRASCARARVRACVRHVRARARVYVCVLGGEGSRVFASTALVVVWTTVYLTGYSDYLISFREPLSPPYRCYIGLTNA